MIASAAAGWSRCSRPTTSISMPMPPWRSLSAAAVVLGVVAAALTLVIGVADEDQPRARRLARPGAAAWRGLVGTPRPPVALGQRVIVLLKAPSLADRVRRAGGLATNAAERRWTVTALASQEQFLAELAGQGVEARPDLQFTRVVNGFSAVADPSAVVLLERSPRVAGVYPVRAAFPAAMAQTSDVTAPLPAAPAGVPWNGDHRCAARHGRGSRDAVSPRQGECGLRCPRRRGGRALRPASGRRPARDARHRDRWHRRGLGRRAPVGVAPDVNVLPIRAAGGTATRGTWSIHGGTDQIIACFSARSTRTARRRP